MAEAALVTQDKLTALSAPFCITRFPATDSAWGRLIEAAVARTHWEAVGGLAQTPPCTSS